MLVDLKYIAQRYIVRSSQDRDLYSYACRLDSAFIAEVAQWYDGAALRCECPDTHSAYAQFKLETFSQFEELVRAGVDIRPWVRSGQPYDRAQDLFREVRQTGTLYVYLTRRGHGDDASSDRNEVTPPRPQSHPMTSLTGIRIGNRDLMYNDLFRAVHDAFGHVMEQVNFSIEGELLAAREHAQLYSKSAHSVMLSETVGQICWFYAGPHLHDGGPRRYSDQKTEPMPRHLVEGFFDIFAPKPGSTRRPPLPIYRPHPLR